MPIEAPEPKALFRLGERELLHRAPHALGDERGIWN
jgi:hypothetical protein